MCMSCGSKTLWCSLLLETTMLFLTDLSRFFFVLFFLFSFFLVFFATACIACIAEYDNTTTLRCLWCHSDSSLCQMSYGELL